MRTIEAGILGSVQKQKMSGRTVCATFAHRLACTADAQLRRHHSVVFLDVADARNFETED